MTLVSDGGQAGISWFYQRFLNASSEKCPGSPKDFVKWRKLWPGFEEEAVTVEHLYTVDVLESLPVSEAGNQCLLIAMDPVTK